MNSQIWYNEKSNKFLLVSGRNLWFYPKYYYTYVGEL